MSGRKKVLGSKFKLLSNWSCRWLMFASAGNPYRNVSQQGMTTLSFCRSKLAAVVADGGTKAAVGLCVGDHVINGGVHLAGQQDISLTILYR